MIAIVLLLSAISCSEDEPPTATKQKQCGDGICDAIEKQRALCPEDCSIQASVSEEPASAGTSFITYVPSDGIGNIAVKVTLPEKPRYVDGAPVLVYISTFFTPQPPLFDTSFLDVTEMGFIHVTYLWPGKSDAGISSDGTYDYGGEDSLQALHDIIRFASGQTPDKNGKYISDLSIIIPLDNIGLYAFSHPGIAAINVLALYGDEMNVDYFVGRENPTVSILSAMDLGYWDKETAVINPYYTYPDSYSSSALDVDYSSVQWDDEQYVPYFDVNGNGQADEETDFIHGIQTPTMYEKDIYSRELTQALLDNGVLTEATWPDDIATPEDAAELWSFREPRYTLLSSTLPDLKVLLVFNAHDHVQPMQDKPHIHQAYNGFTDAGIWIRLNPDNAYVQWLDSSITVPDNNANAEPSNWLSINEWAYTGKNKANSIIPLAAVAEMADRTHLNNWDENLDDILVDAEAPLLS